MGLISKTSMPGIAEGASVSLQRGPMNTLTPCAFALWAASPQGVETRRGKNGCPSTRIAPPCTVVVEAPVRGGVVACPSLAVVRPQASLAASVRRYDVSGSSPSSSTWCSRPMLVSLQTVGSTATDRATLVAAGRLVRHATEIDAGKTETSRTSLIWSGSTGGWSLASASGFGSVGFGGAGLSTLGSSGPGFDRLAGDRVTVTWVPRAGAGTDETHTVASVQSSAGAVQIGGRGGKATSRERR